MDPFIDSGLRENIIATCNHAISKIGFLSGGTHTECRIDPLKDKIFILESACRLGCSGFMYNIFSKAYDFDVLKLYFMSLLKDSKYIENYKKENNISKNPSKIIYNYFVPFNGKG